MATGIKIGRFVVEPRPRELAAGGWLPDFDLVEYLPDCLEDTVLFGTQVMASREEAIEACRVLGRREVLKRLAA